jgi:hypothetical protein
MAKQEITANFKIEIYDGSTSVWTDYAGYTLAGSLNIDHGVNDRSICSFELFDDDGAMTMPAVGQRVRITDGSYSYFGGLLESVEYRALRPGGEPEFKVVVKATDWTALLDRFYVTETYENMTLGAIVNDVINKMNSLDKLDTTNVAAGPMLTKVVFPTLKGQECLDELMRETGYKYWVTYDKKLYVQDRYSVHASWDLTDATAKDRTVGVPIVKRDKTQYRNVQEIKGATTTDDADSFYPAATTAGMATYYAGDKFYTPSVIATNISEISWDLGRPVTSISRVYVKDGPMNTGADYGDVYVCGTGGGNATSPFRYTEGSRFLALNESWKVDGTTIYWWELFPAGQTRYVMVYGKFKSEAAAIARKDAAWCAANGEPQVDTIEQMAEREGGSGIYHQIETNERLTTAEQCQYRANALLKSFGVLPTVVEYTSDNWGDLTVGQYQHVGIYGLDKDCAVKSIKISDIAGKWLRAQVQLVGSEKQSYGQFVRMVASGKTPGITSTYAIRATEVATEFIYPPAEDLTVTESITVSEVDTGGKWGDYPIGEGAEWA